MRIKAEKWIVDGYNPSYKIINIEKCCDELINSENIELNSHDYCDLDECNDYSVKLVRCEYDYDIGYEDYYEKINYCPFCGKPISIKIVNEANKTEEFKTLEKQREEIWNKCRKTDSKKKENELQKQVEELDTKINNILSSDDFEKGEGE